MSADLSVAFYRCGTLSEVGAFKYGVLSVSVTQPEHCLLQGTFFELASVVLFCLTDAEQVELFVGFAFGDILLTDDVAGSDIEPP